MGSELSRMCHSAYETNITISRARQLVMSFDFQCLTVFFLMSLIDPLVHVRIYFLFYIVLLTLPTTYIAMFGDEQWMKIAFCCQLIRMIFIALHNIFYPIFVAGYVAFAYGHAHPEAAPQVIIGYSTGYGLFVFFMSFCASIWEPAKLYQIHNLRKMLSVTPTPSMIGSDCDLEEDLDSVSMSETECTELSDSGYVEKLTTV